jgi:hypothetical protein
MSAAILKRLRAMDGAELRFRATTAFRTRVHRARASVRPPTWDRSQLRISSAAAPRDVTDAIALHDWQAAHGALAAHFQRRPQRFPLWPSRLPALAAKVRDRFPVSTARADRVLDGRYDLLGYRDVDAGAPPAWHRDPVHDRTAPLVFWDGVPYLDPAYGDHKITWEINRHQHFLTLGRAYALTGDRRYYREFVRQLTGWIHANPPLMGTNWASMLELGFRCLSWTWAVHFFAPAASPADDEPWLVDLLLALDRQLTHVEQNLSTYFSPNTHLTGEALALYVTGRAFPELAGADTRANVGRAILLEEAGRQILSDGGHAERSAHYHRYSTDFYLLALNVARASGDPHEDAFHRAALVQARYLRAISDDEGRLALIGDDDGGQLFPVCGRAPWDASDTLASAAVLLREPALATGPLPEEPWWFCGGDEALEGFEAPGSRPASVALEASGYCVSRNEHGDHLVFDCGAHGYLNGGHAHADALSIVLTIGGRPFLVDSGTATYTMDAERRDRFRSTAMHNTVVVNGRPQSVPNGPFHWRSRTDAVRTRWQSEAGRDVMAARHSAYAPIVHEREVTAVHGVGWRTVDWFTGEGAASISAMWHIHPAWQVEAVDGGVARLRHLDGTAAIIYASAPLQQVRTGGLDEYSPEYGRIDRGVCLRCTLAGTVPFSLTTTIPADGSIDTARKLASSVQE